MPCELLHVGGRDGVAACTLGGAMPLLFAFGLARNSSSPALFMAYGGFLYLLLHLVVRHFPRLITFARRKAIIQPIAGMAGDAEILATDFGAIACRAQWMQLLVHTSNQRVKQGDMRLLRLLWLCTCHGFSAGSLQLSVPASYRTRFHATL